LPDAPFRMRPSANDALRGETKTLVSRCASLTVFHRLNENPFDADNTSRSADVRARGSAVRAGPFSPGLPASGPETPPPHATSVTSASGAPTRLIHEFDDDIPPPQALVLDDNLPAKPMAAELRHRWLDATVDRFTFAASAAISPI